jgi:GAF domain-containing protein
MSIEESRDHEQLGHLFAELAQTLGTHDDVDGTLTTICGLAARVVEADHASVTTVVGGRFRTVAQTSPVAARADQLQYGADEGPCLTAIRERDTVRSDELVAEPRWPVFGRAVADELGIRSMLSHVLSMEDGSVGAINLFATRPAAFGASHERLVTMVGTQAAIALRAAVEHERAENLSHAVHSNRRIGMAIGVLMATQQVDEEEAFRRISTASQNTNRKVVDIAEDVLRKGTLPG